MRLVLDTNVVASGLLWVGAPRRLLRAQRGADFRLFTSPPLLVELSDILSGTKFDKKIAASSLSIGELVDSYAQLAALVRPATVPRLAPDPDDDMVIGTALAAKANFIVTGDRSLLSVAEYECGRIVSVTEALTVCSTRWTAE